MSQNWPIDALNSDLDGNSGGLTSSEVSKVEEAVQELLGPDQEIVGVEKKVVVKEVREIVFWHIFSKHSVNKFTSPKIGLY